MQRFPKARSWWWPLRLLLVCSVCWLAAADVQSQTAARQSEVKFGDVTLKFVRNMKLLRGMVDHAELGQMIDVVVKKAEDLQAYNNDKNADEKRFRIMRQMETMVRREGIQESDQKRLEKLQSELRELDPTGSFQKARGEMNRSIQELQNFLGQIHNPDERSEDIQRLIRMHLSLYSRCLSKMN
ncbi:MAG: hypothetical protein SFU85_11950 [Candidatus Methylacidiphilales bacterium]|nr:hypothetical protein [Candidatus Methylacidiphilales bacterium]